MSNHSDQRLSTSERVMDDEGVALRVSVALWRAWSRCRIGGAWSRRERRAAAAMSKGILRGGLGLSGVVLLRGTGTKPMRGMWELLGRLSVLAGDEEEEE